MEAAVIVGRIKKAIAQLARRDAWLWVHNLSERSLAHRLALYLGELFPDYDVDCEYNGDASTNDGMKRIYILTHQLDKMGLLKEDEQSVLPDEIINRLVYPDIIVHRRSTNKHNICIIELKKSTSGIPVDYDRLKLTAYTSSANGNNLGYQLGVFIVLHIGEPGNYDLEFFRNGSAMNIPI